MASLHPGSRSAAHLLCKNLESWHKIGGLDMLRTIRLGPMTCREYSFADPI